MPETQERKKEKNLPKHWEWKKLGEVVKIVSGSTPKGIEDTTGEGVVPFFKVSDMNESGNETYLIKSKIYQTEEEVLKLKTKIFPKGTVVFPKRGGAILTNKKRVLAIPSTFDLNLMGFIPGSRLNNKYLFYWVQNLDLSKIYDGSNVPQINNKNVEPLKIPLPPLPEQHLIVQKIEELFSELDNAITTLKSTQQQLQTYRQSVLKHAFEGHFTGGMKSWKVDKVGNLIEKMQYGSSEKSDERPDGLPVLRMGNIQDSKIEFENLKYLPENLKGINDYILNEGDVLFNRTNSAELVGKTGLYKKGMPKAVFASYLIRVVTNRSELLPEYFNYYMNSHFGKQFIKSVVSQNVGQANVNGSKLKGMEIQLPKPDIQEKILFEIETRLSESDYLLQTINQQLTHAESLRQSILQRAFSGEL